MEVIRGSSRPLLALVAIVIAVFFLQNINGASRYKSCGDENMSKNSSMENKWQALPGYYRLCELVSYPTYVYTLLYTTMEWTNSNWQLAFFPEIFGPVGPPVSILVFALNAVRCWTLQFIEELFFTICTTNTRMGRYYWKILDLLSTIWNHTR